MFEWIARLFAKPRPTPGADALEPVNAKRSPDEVLLDLLEQLPREGIRRWPAAAAAFDALPSDRLLDPVFSSRVLKDLFVAMATVDADVRQTLALSQIALIHFPAMRSAAASDLGRAPGARPVPIALVEGVLLMRSGQFDLAFERLALANLERAARAVADWSEKLPGEEVTDFVARSAALAAETLINLENPDLRFWGRTVMALPLNPHAVLDPEAVLMSAGDLVLELHRAAAVAVTYERPERSRILADADRHYEALFRAHHPQAEDCRRMMRRIEKMFGILPEEEKTLEA